MASVHTQRRPRLTSPPSSSFRNGGLRAARLRSQLGGRQPGMLEQVPGRSKPGDRLRELQTFKGVQELVYGLGWVLQRLALFPHRSVHTDRIQIEEMADEIVGVPRVNSS